MRLLTTDDGTVGSLFQGLSGFSWLTDEIRKISWDHLSYAEQLRLIRVSARARAQDFFSDRSIHGLRPRPVVKLKFEKETMFLGKRYEPGTHDVDVSSVLGTRVEYRGVGDLAPIPKNERLAVVSGIELHFRWRAPSGSVSNDAWVLLEGAQIPRIYQHVHIVAPIPAEALAAAPEIHSAMMGDFFRRTNLFAEMFGVVDKGDAIYDSEHDGAIYFSSLKAEALADVTRYFLDVAEGKSPKIGDTFKDAWVGMRGSDKYDQPGLWGIEYREVSRSDSPGQVKIILDAVQWSMSQDSYGLGKERVQRWMASRPPWIKVPDMLRMSWYNQPWKTLFKSMPPLVKQRVGIERQVREAFEQKFKQHTEAKMLFFDWSKDPLVFAHPELAEKIANAQVRAISQIEAGGKINATMKEFLEDTGLFRLVAQSIGVSIDVLRAAK